ncbi:SGNH/GDSL hydrolase family protein [Nocardioides jiangxiensis]|uniref:SGNH/GDSL hydrolase family protein n=1 Tax=Nocardioides jiangxiensis TaxID=3064524 RepID=A0ABT9B278_9ACTN|nr:SGNH/GDSL hydrolase family protein [Nocardioides sp. WY-20]MDO7867273.1 SGNH/GDSL hydrolase family protein [Nocardioides sp. WY-20]
MRVLIAGDSHLARPVRGGWSIAPGAVSVAVGGSVATDLPCQVATLDPSAYDVVVVSIGTNDAGWREVPLEEFRAAVSGFLSWAGQTPVLLMTSPGCDESRASGHWSDARLRAYADAAAEAVTRAGGSVLSTPSVLAPLGAAAFVEDGFHLTPAAYDLLLPALAEAARATGRSR